MANYGDTGPQVPETGEWGESKPEYDARVRRMLGLDKPMVGETRTVRQGNHLVTQRYCKDGTWWNIDVAVAR